MIIITENKIITTFINLYLSLELPSAKQSIAKLVPALHPFTNDCDPTPSPAQSDVS